MVRIHTSVGLWGILNFPKLRDQFLYLLARGSPLIEGVQLPLQSTARTPPPHLRLSILALLISLNACLPPRPLHADDHSGLHPPYRLPAIIVHQHPEEPPCILFSVSNGSKFPGRFRVWFHPKPDRCNGSYHTKNLDRKKWGGYITKNPAFQVHNFRSN